VNFFARYYQTNRGSDDRKVLVMPSFFYSQITDDDGSFKYNETDKGLQVSPGAWLAKRVFSASGWGVALTVECWRRRSEK